MKIQIFVLIFFSININIILNFFSLFVFILSSNFQLHKFYFVYNMTIITFRLILQFVINTLMKTLSNRRRFNYNILVIVQHDLQMTYIK